MMLFLIPNVFANRVQRFDPDGLGEVTILPSELRFAERILIYPPRRLSLQLLRHNIQHLPRRH